MYTSYYDKVAYSAVECARARLYIRRVGAPAPQPEPSNRLRSPMREVSFLWSDSMCRQYVSDLSNFSSRYSGSEQKGRVSLLDLTLSSRLASLLLRWKAADTVFVVMSFSFHVWRSGDIHLQLPCPWSAPLPLPASLHQHSRLLDRQHMHAFWRRWLAGQRYRCWREWVSAQTLWNAVLEAS